MAQRKKEQAGGKIVDMHIRVSRSDLDDITHQGRKTETSSVYDAIRTYRWLLKRHREGWKVGAIPPNGGAIEMPFCFGEFDESSP